MARSLRLSDRYVVYPLDFYNPPRDSTRPLPVFYTRDVHPQLLLYGALAERGRRLGESILNYPPPDGWNPGDTLYDTELELGPRHEVLVTTRPPLCDDESYDEPKQVLRGYTLIEWQVMQALRPYFEHLSRSQPSGKAQPTGLRSCGAWASGRWHTPSTPSSVTARSRSRSPRPRTRRDRILRA